jgi:hypothetical protein
MLLATVVRAVRAGCRASLESRRSDIDQDMCEVARYDLKGERFIVLSDKPDDGPNAGYA